MTKIDKKILESGQIFAPQFAENGLIPAIVTDAGDGHVLMLGYMNEAALQKTLSLGKVTFYSRSRQSLWTKGETSGHFLSVEEILVDCDQDALLIKSVAKGPTCHTNRRSCFYRRVEGDAALTFVENDDC
ncbi:phosphoribosyl-AMP cyclohydrolase [Sphingorhabdus lutea]|uniref:Phosphoribosyl-AMP cyclohydrolase n=1 Tax=Sphingorhabdus lutea TaxID=1913578 RepID=A0A1L3JF20_9SPHN|nr:phosphoribosyl-AMP cyclohydrolase [Sphingorhabdus lutea]APG63720.1 phosphoribosyl-AMP cyclohydrolase [Sphingorhabdus lutea]